MCARQSSHCHVPKDGRVTVFRKGKQRAGLSMRSKLASITLAISVQHCRRRRKVLLCMLATGEIMIRTS